MQTEKTIGIIGGVGIGLPALIKPILPEINVMMLTQPRLIEQPEERQKIDLMALISQVSNISEQSYKLTHHINNFREKVSKRRTYPRVVSGWVIKVFLRKKGVRK
ncbi:hypothetical protein QM480_06600 [Flectobacillus sp. DC10W]|uniref:Uncharacterized protein n=1 Tax=Flectobacillus longus TaxID=2984207 RepID=A0ABT6YK93_9BACT|nr:hypothetical protein [Flectobacillus longus]MDI9863985.1 hypothetical protein [Flectobacillus longus]